MDRLGPGSASETAVLGLRWLPKKEGEMGSCEEALDESHEGLKPIKMRDLESVLRSEGMKMCNLDGLDVKETEAHRPLLKEEGTCQIREATASVHSDIVVPMTTGHNPLKLDAACLSLGHIGSIKSYADQGHDAALQSNREAVGPCFPRKPDKEHGHCDANLVSLGVDLNAVDVPHMVDHNPFYPYKQLGQVKPTDASECGSTTGPVEESEPLRMWKEMKQNGFLSSSHGGIPMPKQRGCQSRKRKAEELKTKRESVNRFTKFAAPSGLLSGLNPGIINHVRNSRQVHSIIEAIVRSEKLDGHFQDQPTDKMGRASKEICDKRKEHIPSQNAAANECCLSLNKPPHPNYDHRSKSWERDMFENKFHHNISAASPFTAEDDEMFTLKLSSAVTMASENASSASTEDFSANQQYPATLYVKAATVASQWLELLQQDIKGRLAALKRSKKRVRHVIQIELPCLLSTEFSHNQENDPHTVHSSEGGYSHKSVSDMHVARWKSLFSQMDKALYDEGKHLEVWLRQVQDMQLHCEKGLQCVGADGLSQVGSSEDSSKLTSEAFDQVRAAAASLYSTCDFVMTRENVPCF